MDEDPPLSLASYVQIFAELQKRFAGLVVIRERPVNDANEEDDEFAFGYAGGQSTAIGMIERAKRVLLASEDGKFEDDPLDDDE